jgi:hypothetical protein
VLLHFGCLEYQLGSLSCCIFSTLSKSGHQTLGHCKELWTMLLPPGAGEGWDGGGSPGCQSHMTLFSPYYLDLLSEG